MSNKKNKGDNTSRTRGFIYQTLYFIYLFLNDDIKEIINEGTINNKSYEDITIINTNDTKDTYQLKYTHNINDKQSFCASNEIIKVLNRDDNYNLNNIYYVSNSGFNENFNIFVKNNGEKIYEELNNMYQKYLQNKKYQDKEHDFIEFCKTKLNSENKTTYINYLNKIQINYDENINTYTKILKKIDERIQRKFRIENKKDIFFIRQMIYKISDDSFFTDNKTFIKIDEEIEKIKNEIGLNNQEIKNNIINDFIEKIKYTLINENNTIDYKIIENFNNLKREINDLLDIEPGIIIIDILNLLHDIYIKLPNENNIKNDVKIFYDEIKCKLCILIFNKYKNYNNEVDNKKLLNIIPSLNTYKNHKIDKKIKIDISKVKWLFE